MPVTPHQTPADSPLFATLPIVTEPRPGPVIVIGLPRSGSSYLSYILSQIRDWYVFDDLYFYRKATALGVDGALSNTQLQRLIDYLGRLLKARIERVTFEAPKCSLADVDHLQEAMSQTFRNRAVHWHQLMEEWLTRLARHHGCSHWGYKTPQEFMHIDMLKVLFPELRFIFICRDPRNVMASYKFVGPDDGHVGQYHPLVYARYWRMSVEAVTAAAAATPGRFHFVKFEQLIADPNREAEKLALFLDSTLEHDVQRSDPNTSFQSNRRTRITPTETWICERIAGKMMQTMGFTRQGARPRIRDLGDLLATSYRFVVYQTGRAFKHEGARQAIKAYIKRLVRP